MYSDYNLILPEKIKNPILYSNNTSEHYPIEIYTFYDIFKKKSILTILIIFLIYTFEKTYGHMIKFNKSIGFMLILIIFTLYLLVYHFI